MAGTNCKDCGRFRPKDPALPCKTCTRFLRSYGQYFFFSRSEEMERARKDDEVVLPLQQLRQDEKLKDYTETDLMEQSFSSIASLSSDTIRELMKDMLGP
ncbi:unnamed protein product, partial [Mesorhabditis spiculigera]